MTPDHNGELRRGTVFGFLAYAIWGVFPLYFHALRPAGAWEILAHRILWTLLLCAVVLLVRRDLSWTRQLLARPRLALGVAVAALLIAANWVIYVAAVIGGHTTEAALGYFLNPIVTVALGVVVLRERLRPLQWAAVAIGAAAGVYLSVAGGRSRSSRSAWRSPSPLRAGEEEGRREPGRDALAGRRDRGAVPGRRRAAGVPRGPRRDDLHLEPPVHPALLSRPGWSPRCRCCSSRRPRGGSH